MGKANSGWTLEQGVALCQEIEALVRPMNYHTMLGGGVLHAGHSDNDLDIWLFPLNGHESNSSGICGVLKETFGLVHPIRDSPDYAAGEPYHINEMWYVLYQNKRIDFFVK